MDRSLRTMVVDGEHLGHVLEFCLYGSPNVNAAAGSGRADGAALQHAVRQARLSVREDWQLHRVVEEVVTVADEAKKPGLSKSSGNE